MEPIGTTFVTAMKMLIGPIVFLTIVGGIASVADLKKVGMTGIKSLTYFQVGTIIAMCFGLVAINIFRVGDGVNADPGTIETSESAQKLITTGETKQWWEFITHLVPDSVVGPFVEGDILQIIFMAVLFGVALNAVGHIGGPVLDLINRCTKITFKILNYIMKLAPLGAFGAMAYAIGKYGVSTLTSLGSLIGLFYLTSALFVFVVFGSVMAYLRLNIIHMLRYLREELLLILGTSTAEPALPGLIRKLEYAGVSKPTVGLVVPTGYSFNLDGAAIYLSLAALYIAQATNTPLSIGQQLGMLAVMLLTSKGAAGVAGGGFIALTATLSTLGTIPVVGIMLIFGIDKFMSECRALVNFIGNAVATLFVAKWNGELDVVRARAVFAGKDVEPLFDPSEDLDVNPYDPERPRTRQGQPRPAGHGRRPAPMSASDTNGHLGTARRGGDRKDAHQQRVVGEPPYDAAHRPARPHPYHREMETHESPHRTRQVQRQPHRCRGRRPLGERPHRGRCPHQDPPPGRRRRRQRRRRPGHRVPSPPGNVHGATGQDHHGVVAFDVDTAIVEVANTCGLATLPGGVLAPMTASSYGFGEAIRAALTLSRHRLVLALGGSASTDGGIGMLAALGYRFLDPSARLLTPTAENLGRIHCIDAHNAVRLDGVEVIVAGDVTSPLVGLTGAAAVFGPQKGVTAAQVTQLDDGLLKLVSALTRSGFEAAENFAHAPGSGAAGGIGFAAMLLGATIVSGAEYFLDLLNFDGLVADADLVITGEGRLDDQTLQGKLPAAVALRCAPAPVVAVVGRNDLDDDTARTHFDDVFAVADLAEGDTSRDPRRTAEVLQHIGTQIGAQYTAPT